jgi:hypothetical protein
MTNLILELDPVLVPRLATGQQNESAAGQGVKRVGDLNPPLIVQIMRSTRLTTTRSPSQSLQP